MPTGLQGLLHDGVGPADVELAVPDGGQQPADYHLGSDGPRDLHDPCSSTHERWTGTTEFTSANKNATGCTESARNADGGRRWREQGHPQVEQAVHKRGKYTQLRVVLERHLRAGNFSILLYFALI